LIGRLLPAQPLLLEEELLQLYLELKLNPPSDPHPAVARPRLGVFILLLELQEVLDSLVEVQRALVHIRDEDAIWETPKDAH